MSSAWSRLSREQRRAWGVICGVIVGGSATKVAYFNFSRGMIVADTERLHQDGLERLAEAKTFSEWSRKDRESRLPPLTPEQKEQMGQYLRLVEAHGWTKSLEQEQGGQGKECIGCPFMERNKRKAKAIRAETETSSSLRKT